MNINLAYSKQKGILIQTVDTKRKETMNHQYWNMEKLSFIKGYMQSYQIIQLSLNPQSALLTLQASRISLSVSNDITSTPTMGEHDLRVMTFRTKGWPSP